VSATNEKICPRCRRPYSYIKEVSRERRDYLYAVHYEGTEKVNGKKYSSRPMDRSKESFSFQGGRRSAFIIIL